MLFAPKSQNGFGLIEFIVLLGLLAIVVYILITLAGPFLFANKTINTVEGVLP